MQKFSDKEKAQILRKYIFKKIYWVWRLISHKRQKFFQNWWFHCEEQIFLY